MQDVIRMTYDIAPCHPDEITNLIPKSHGWLSYSQNPVRMTYGHCSMSPGWHTILPYLIRTTWRHLNPNSSKWVSAWPYLIRMTYGRCIMSSGWLSWRWYLIQMSYDNTIMSSGSDTLPFLSHRNEIANFAVALQRFRTASYGSAEGQPRVAKNRNLRSYPDDLRMKAYKRCRSPLWLSHDLW